MHKPDQTQQCIHEAAHAVVGHVLGLDIIGVRLVPDTSNTSLMSIMAVPDLTWDENESHWWTTWATYSVAGDAAINGTLSESDREQVDLALERCAQLGVPFTQDDARELATDILLNYEREHLHLSSALRLYDDTVMPRMVLLSYLPDMSKEIRCV